MIEAAVKTGVVPRKPFFPLLLMDVRDLRDNMKAPKVDRFERMTMDYR